MCVLIQLLQMVEIEVIDHGDSESSFPLTSLILCYLVCAVIKAIKTVVLCLRRSLQVNDALEK